MAISVASSMMDASSGQVQKTYMHACMHHAGHLLVALPTCTHTNADTHPECHPPAHSHQTPLEQWSGLQCTCAAALLAPEGGRARGGYAGLAADPIQLAGNDAWR